MQDEFGGFTLEGNASQETRTLVHTSGFRAGIPGHPTAFPGSELPPVSHIRVRFADKPVEVSYRFDRIETSMEPRDVAIADVTALAQSRAVRPPVTSLIRAQERARGTDAGSRATYAVSEDDTMECATILMKREEPSALQVMLQVITFRKADLSAAQFASLRTSMAAAQSWQADGPSTFEVWAPSRFVGPSIEFELVEHAAQEARSKAEDIGHVDPEELTTVAKYLIGVLNEELGPAVAAPPQILDIMAGRIAMSVDSRVAEVLLRNLYDAVNIQDLRGWAWQCLWALEHRASQR